MKKIRIIRADPAGNITVFVLSDTTPEERPALAARIMAISELQAEQVAFACPAPRGTDGAFSMMGGEFCGNASRSYGLLLAKMEGLTGIVKKRLQVSGCERPITVTVDTVNGTAEAEMPLSKAVLPVSENGISGTLVDLGGIAHLVVTDREPSVAFFREAEPLFKQLMPIDAYGICFVKGNTLTPLVKVPATDTLVFEGSCGSGALAAAIAMSVEGKDGCYRSKLIQPSGVIDASITRRNGVITAASIGGSVQIGEPMEITI